MCYGYSNRKWLLKIIQGEDMTKKISAWTMFVRAFLVALFAGTPASQAQQSGVSDDAAWSYAVTIGTAAAVREYLRNFPTGVHIEEAVRLLLSFGELSTTGTLPQLQITEPGGNLY